MTGIDTTDDIDMLCTKLPVIHAYVVPPSVDAMRRLADHIHRRMDELGLTQADVADNGGPSTTRMRMIDAVAERGAQPTDFKPGTLRNLDNVLHWESGSARRVLDGGDPRPLPGTARGTSYAFNLPPALAAIMAEVAPTERAEVEARMVAEAFRCLRELRPPR